LKRDPKINLVFILECIEFLEEYLRGISETEFMHSTKLQDAVIRRIELIGEAVKNLPPAFKERYTDLPWKRIAGMRDILIHDYLGIDLKVTWQVARSEIPQLKEKVLRIKNVLERQDA